MQDLLLHIADYILLIGHSRFTLSAQRGAAENLAWWLSRPAEERIAEVERLRKSYYGTIPRLERVARVVSQTQR